MDSLSEVSHRLIRAGRAMLVAARDTLSPAMACERAARLAIYVQSEPLARNRRVLDVCCGRGWGAAHLLAAGATQVVGLERSALASRATRRFGQPGLDFCPLDTLQRNTLQRNTVHRDAVHRDPPTLPDLGPFDLVTCTRSPEQLEPMLDAIIERLAPGSQLVLAVREGASSRWRDRLREFFLSVEIARLHGTSSDNLHFEFLSPREEPSSSHTQTLAPTDTVFEVLTASAPRRLLPAGPLRLHIGSGSQRIEDWVNVDIRPFPGVDLVADVNRGLDFASVDAVYAEHFLEHLAADDALVFLAAIHRMLTPEGRIRLSTPNLDWVWRTHYRLEGSPERKIGNALEINRAFHGWEHKFLWNREALTAALTAIGFTDLRWYRHGESDDATFRGLERHETYLDTNDLPHVLIVEARRGQVQPAALASLRQQLQRDFLDHVAGY